MSSLAYIPHSQGGRLPAALTALWLALMIGPQATAADKAEQARNKADQVISYVALAETITRVDIQIAEVLNKHPTDRTLAAYAVEVGRLHDKLYAKMNPPDGTDDFHRRFKAMLANFTKSAEARMKADFADAKRYGDECGKAFLQALVELGKMRDEGVLAGNVITAK